jgi:hypothetical protein
MKVQCVYAGKCQFTDCWHHAPHEETNLYDSGGDIPEFTCGKQRRLCDWQTKKIAVCCVPVGKKRTVKKTNEKEHPMVSTVKKLASMDVANACAGTATCGVDACNHYGPHKPNSGCKLKCPLANRSAWLRIMTRRNTAVVDLVKAKAKVAQAHRNLMEAIDERKYRVEAIGERKYRVDPDLVKCSLADDPGCITTSCRHYGWHTKSRSCRMNRCVNVKRPVQCRTRGQIKSAEDQADKILNDVIMSIMRVVDRHRATGKSTQELQQHNIDSKVAVQIKLQTLHRLPGE